MDDIVCTLIDGPLAGIKLAENSPRIVWIILEETWDNMRRLGVRTWGDSVSSYRYFLSWLIVDGKHLYYWLRWKDDYKYLSDKDDILNTLARMVKEQCTD